MPASPLPSTDDSSRAYEGPAERRRRCLCLCPRRTCRRAGRSDSSGRHRAPDPALSLTATRAVVPTAFR